MKLVRFDEINENEYLEYILEWEKANETIIPGASDRKGRSYSEMIEKWKANENRLVKVEGKVPSTLYFMTDEKKNIIGALDFRHELNEQLLVHGGHIGYGVLPSRRREGNCSFMLKTFIEMIKDKKMERVLLTCDESNIGSIKTIEKCKGILENKVEINGKMVRRYWIELK